MTLKKTGDFQATSNAAHPLREPYRFHPNPRATADMILVPPATSVTDTFVPTELKLTNADLVWVQMDSVSEVPARLDVDRLRAALSKTLAAYRPACGRIRKHGPMDWKIHLTNSPMPMEVVECANPPQFDDYVSQPQEEISSLLPRTRKVPWDVINNDLPLVSLKVTLSAHKTMLGVSWHHALGDGTTRFRFISLLSRYYQDLDPLHPLLSFAGHRIYTPDGEDATRQDDYLAYFRALGGTSEMLETVTPSTRTGFESPNAVVRWIVPRVKANILRQNIQQGIGLKVSVQDCLTAYVASVVHESGYDVRQINYTFVFRGPGLAKLDLAGNFSLTMPIGTFEDAEIRDPRRVALKIRQRVIASRTPEGIAEYLRPFEHFLHSCAEKGDWPTLAKCVAIPNTLCGNAMGSISWSEAANFGHPGTKYYVADNSSRLFYVRIHPANPTIGRSAADALDVSFTAPKSVYSKIMEKLEEKYYLLPWL